MTYGEKLKEPRWQKKRLEVLQACQWKCVDCFSDSKPLHVHHLIYRKGAEPWDYEPLSDLVALCEDCHEVRTYDDASLKESLTDGVFRDLCLMLSAASGHNEREPMFAGMAGRFYIGLWNFLSGFCGITTKLSGDLTEERRQAGIDSYNNVLAYAKNVKDELDAMMLAHRDALAKFHRRENDA